MAEAKEDKSVPKKILKRFKRLGRKEEVKVAEFTEVGIRRTEYRTHKASEWVSLQQVPTWKDYAANVSFQDAEESRFAANDILNNKISLYNGDITTLKIDAIVTSASTNLISLGEVGHYVHTAAGPELSRECAEIASHGICPLGQARLTKGYKLPAKYVIHGVGPRGRDETILRNCYRSCLDIAKKRQIRTIAFPCIGTLFCGYDSALATPVAVSAVREWLLEDNIKHIDRIIFSVITPRNKELYERNLFKYFPLKHDTVPVDIKQDPYARALYEKAIKEGKETDKIIRVHIVGNYGQGKTSLKRRLTGQDIKDVQSTNSIDINRYKFTKTSDGKVLCANDAENESQDLIGRIVEVARTTKMSDDENEADVIEDEVFDEVDGGPFVLSTEQETDLSVVNELTETEPVEENKHEIAQHLKLPSHNKPLLSNEDLVSFSNELKKSDSLGGDTKKVLDIWDFGGQFVFYATHTMFHSRQAVYLLVFNLSVALNDIVRDEEFPGETGTKNMEYFIRFWMNSIHSYVGSEDGLIPPVILVGTHKDMLDGDIDMKCESYFDKIRELFDGTNIGYHIHEKDFALSNKDPTDENVEMLLREILEIGDVLSKLVEIPAKWLPLEKALKEKKSLKIILFEDVKQMDAENDFPLFDENQIKLFLRYHHSKGTLFYFEEEPISEYIVLDPQYLIDAFKCLITSERFCLKNPYVRDSWKRLITEGRLEDALIEHVWSKDSEHRFIDKKPVLLEFLKKHHIISEVMNFDEDSKVSNGLGRYIVPSLLKDQSKTSDLSDFMKDRKRTEIRFVMNFDNASLLQTVYSRIIAALLGKREIVHMPNNPKNCFLFENLGAFKLEDDHVGVIEVRTSSIELMLLKLCPSLDINSAVADKFRRYCEAIVTHEFRHLRSKTDALKKPYVLAFRCNHESHDVDGSKSIESISTLEKAACVPCPDLRKHDICSEKALNQWFLKDELENVDENKPLSEKDLSRIAQAIGQNWQLLAIELGLSKVQIEHVNADNDTTVMKIFCMLKAWANKHPATSNINVLKQAMKDIKDLTVDWDEIRNICDDYT